VITTDVTTIVDNGRNLERIRESRVNFLGDEILPLLTLAIGGALALGTLAALLRPRTEVKDGDLERPPIGRSLIQIAIGSVASVWAVASLIA
jgi:hypothetical protein